MKETTRSYAAAKFMEKYVKEHNIPHVSELFSKDELIMHTYEMDWEWSIKDEMAINGCSEKEAQKKTEEWFQSMSKLELWQDRIPETTKSLMLECKADDLGFEFLEWKFVISNFDMTEVYADSTVCYNDTYNTNKEALEWANKYVEEHNLKGYLIRIYKRNFFACKNEAWELYSRYGA